MTAVPLGDPRDRLSESVSEVERTHQRVTITRELGGLRSARRGDYRVLYGGVEDARTVEIVHPDRGSDVYRR